MNLEKLVKESLIRNGMDGLYNAGCCACLIDDLFPCGEPHTDCEGGVICKGEDDYCEVCEDTGEKCEFHIGPKPPAKEEKK